MTMFTISGEPKEAAKARRKVLEEFDDLEFIEEGHIYTLNGRNLSSASGIGRRFIREPFNEQKQAAIYAKRHGATAAYWIKEWQCKAFRASTLGTKTHAFGESLSYLRAGHPEFISDLIRNQYLPEHRYLAPIHAREDAVVHFLDELPSSYHLVLNEAKAYTGKNPVKELNPKEQICGTFDMLYYYDGDGDKSRSGYAIFDYKTNINLFSQYNRRYGKMLAEPFSDFIEEDFSLYAIQLSLYAMMIEDIGLPVIERKIVWLREDDRGEGIYEILDVPDLSQRLRQVL